METDAIISALRSGGLIVTSPQALSELVTREVAKHTSKEVTRAQALEILGVSLTKFKKLENSENTLLRRTYAGGRGRNNETRYLRTSVEVEKQRMSKLKF